MLIIALIVKYIVKEQYEWICIFYTNKYWRVLMENGLIYKTKMRPFSIIFVADLVKTYTSRKYFTE